MRSIVLILVSLFAMSSTAGSKTPTKLLEINCTYVSNQNRTIEAIGFGLNKDELSYVEVEKVSYIKNVRKAGKKFRLDFVKPEGLSMIWTFRNEKTQTELNVFGDDMGGMSSLKVGRTELVLTCGVEQL